MKRKRKSNKRPTDQSFCSELPPNHSPPQPKNADSRTQRRGQRRGQSAHCVRVNGGVTTAGSKRRGQSAHCVRNPTKLRLQCSIFLRPEHSSEIDPASVRKRSPCVQPRTPLILALTLPATATLHRQVPNERPLQPVIGIARHVIGQRSSKKRNQEQPRHPQ